MDPAAQILLNYTTDRVSMSIQYLHTTTHQPRTFLYPVFSSLGPMDSERRELCISFAFFQKDYSPHGRVNQTVATNQK